MDPCILEIRIDLGIGSELKVYVDVCLERLKVICCWEKYIIKRSYTENFFLLKQNFTYQFFYDWSEIFLTCLYVYVCMSEEIRL